MYSGFNGNLKNGINQLTNFSNGVGSQLAPNMANLAKQNMAQGANFGGQANSIYQNYGNAGASANAINQLTRGFYDAQGVNGQIEASLRDARRGFGEDTVLRDSSAASLGMSGSSRAGVEQAIAQRSAQDRAADVSSGIRGQAMSSAQQMAQGVWNNSGQMALAGNQQVGNAGQMGAGFGQQAINAAQSNANLNIQGGTVLQQQQQRYIDNQRGLWDQNNGGYQLGVQGRLAGILGNNGGYNGGANGGSESLLGTGLTLAGTAVGAYLGSYGGPAGTVAGAAAGGQIGGTVAGAAGAQ
jgi:hypothetical protein